MTSPAEHKHEQIRGVQTLNDDLLSTHPSPRVRTAIIGPLRHWSSSAFVDFWLAANAVLAFHLVTADQSAHGYEPLLIDDAARHGSILYLY